MFKIYEIKVESCKDEGKGVSCCLCCVLFVLVVVYGGKLLLQSIQIEYNIILFVVKYEWFFFFVFDLNVDGNVQKVLVCDWQKYLYKQQMMYMDFLCIDENVVVCVNVLLYFFNQEILVVGKIFGVVILYNLIELEVFCLLKDLLEFIEFDLVGFKFGDIVYFLQIKLFKGVELLVLVLGVDYDIVVVIVNMVKEEVEEILVVVEGEEKLVGDKK